MGLRINQNIAALNAYRNLTVSDSQLSKSLEKLSSGFRIKRKRVPRWQRAGRNACASMAASALASP